VGSHGRKDSISQKKMESFAAFEVSVSERKITYMKIRSPKNRIPKDSPNQSVLLICIEIRIINNDNK